MVSMSTWNFNIIPYVQLVKGKITFLESKFHRVRFVTSLLQYIEYTSTHTELSTTTCRFDSDNFRANYGWLSRKTIILFHKKKRRKKCEQKKKEIYQNQSFADGIENVCMYTDGDTDILFFLSTQVRKSGKKIFHISMGLSMTINRIFNTSNYYESSLQVFIGISLLFSL